MSIRIMPTIPDENIVKLYQEEIKAKYGTQYMFLGKELQEAMKLHLTLKYGIEFMDDHSLDQLLGRCSDDTHTQTVLDDQVADLNRLIDPGLAKSKTQRAFVVLNNLKRVYLNQFTQNDYSIAIERLFEHSDYRTIKSNLKILVLNNAIKKENMRLGKKNKHKQIYSFNKNDLYIYKNLGSLEEFINLFKVEYERGNQITLKDIQFFLERELIINSQESTQNYVRILEEKGIIKEHETEDLEDLSYISKPVPIFDLI